MIKSESTDMVRNFAAVKGTLSRQEARESLDLTSDQVVYAFDNLVKQGHLRRIGHGLYQFIDAVEKPPVEKLDKVWKAMRISPTFSAAEIAKLADTTSSYVYKRFRMYRADGLMKPAGQRRTHGSGHEKLWRLTRTGKEKAMNPRVATFEPNPVVMASLSLNRLVCSEVALRYAEMAKEAIKQLEIVREGLNAVLDES